MKNKQQRRVGNKTRSAIIKAARILFVKYGFSGTSLTQIAEKAVVSKSLIVHHFISKAQLWKVVKCSFFATIPAFDLNESKRDAITFLTNFINHRFLLYDKNPDIARMISWQRLEEENADDLFGMGRMAIPQCIDIVRDFQMKKAVRNDLDAELMLLWIAASVSGIFLLKKKPFASASTGDKHAYKDLLIHTILNALL